MADDRTYIRLHDGMPDHPKVDPLSDAAFRLLITGWCWCSRHLTDGVMPARTWAKRGTAKARAELVKNGLVQILDSGDIDWHDYLEHQRSAAQVAAMKEQRRSAGRAGGLAKGKRVANHTASEPLSNSSSKTEASTETEERTTSSLTAAGFEAFWQAYPHKVGKQAAAKAYKAALRKTTADALLAGAERYRDDPTRDPAYTAHPATWLNAGRWEDEGPARPGNVRNLPSRQMPAGADPHKAHLWEQG